jgi:hypothetical protein
MQKNDNLERINKRRRIVNLKIKVNVIRYLDSYDRSVYKEDYIINEVLRKVRNKFGKNIRRKTVLDCLPKK